MAPQEAGMAGRSAARKVSGGGGRPPSGIITVASSSMATSQTLPSNRSIRMCALAASRSSRSPTSSSRQASRPDSLPSRSGDQPSSILTSRSKRGDVTTAGMIIRSWPRIRSRSSWTVGASLAVNIFDPVRTHHHISRAVQNIVHHGVSFAMKQDVVIAGTALGRERPVLSIPGGRHDPASKRGCRVGGLRKELF